MCRMLMTQVTSEFKYAKENAFKPATPFETSSINRFNLLPDRHYKRAAVSQHGCSIIP